METPPPVVRDLPRVLLASASDDLANALQERLGHAVRLMRVGLQDTLSGDVAAFADVVLLDFSENEAVSERLAQFLHGRGEAPMVFTIGTVPPTAAVVKLFPRMRPLPIDPAADFVRGLVEAAAQFRSAQVRVESQAGRIRALYELTSSIAKVSHRRHLAKALEESLPTALGASMILLSFPLQTTPVVYFHTREGLGESKLRALRKHLEDAWGILRPDTPADWDWIHSLGSGRPGRDEQVRPTSFTSAPIHRGSDPEGFLTFLPIGEPDHEEAFLQAFFIISDLLSTILQNLQLRERLEQRATHDSLTRLLNRQTLLDLLEKECRRSQRYDSPLSLVLLDLDLFRSVNDRAGHQAGDDLLRQIGTLLTESIREMDAVGRSGGEEFAILLPSTDAAGAKIWAERLRASLAEGVFNVNGKSFRVTGSLGIASAQGNFAIAGNILARADSALYRAKSLGRNRVELADEQV